MERFMMVRARGISPLGLKALLCILLAYHLSSHASTLSAQEPTSPGEQSTGQQLSETVSGTTIITNRAYALSFAPAPQYPIQAFHNDIRMTPVIGYTVHGKNVTVSSGIKIVDADVFRFTYSVDVNSQTGSELDASRKRSSTEMLSRFLDDALTQELESLPAMSAAQTPTQTAPALKSPMNTEELTSVPCNEMGSPSRVASPVSESADSALRTLAEAISNKRRQRPTSPKARSRLTESEGAKGVEGLGDQSLSGELFNLAMTQPGFGRGRELTAGVDIPCQRSPSTSPMYESTALRLLLQSVDTSK